MRVCWLHDDKTFLKRLNFLTMVQIYKEQSHSNSLAGQHLSMEDQLVGEKLECLKEIIVREYVNVDVSSPKAYTNMQIYPWRQRLWLSPTHSNAIIFE
ncbi:AraC family transcriptional regulator [Methylophaga lonarensis MPL]|uniref:AraC family transcriptional regulator n=1 Tax=Methylophaga lonarensis MPL TaxID=1286106 RepID=M7NUF1_9GAMM|nr:AraC family transcriptional regulator [Methylophaga lonarensis MPL]